MNTSKKNEILGLFLAGKETNLSLLSQVKIKGETQKIHLQS
tara:strand:- start:151362 stop:151484 length:123 start_codon:yes stop_codon:yes gene_type:complete